MKLTIQQIDILDHAANRAAQGYYCGGGSDIEALVAAGLLEFSGYKSWVPDPYYRITSKGRQLLHDQKTQP